MISVALFNNKGGVGKTTLTYHLAHMLSRIGKRVLAVDLDPQANLTAAFLPEEDLEVLWEAADELFPQPSQPSLFPRTDLTDTVADAVELIRTREGGVRLIEPIEINDGLCLLPGDLDLGAFEDTLSGSWLGSLAGNEGDIRVTSAFYQIIKHAARSTRADIVLIDVGPNLGAINRSALLAADTVLVPLAADLYSLMGLRNLGPALRDWRKKWRRSIRSEAPPSIVFPEGDMTPIGYVVMQPTFRLDRPVSGYERWLKRIPVMYREAILGGSESSFSYEVGAIRSYRSLAPLAQDAHRPMFDLRPADGAIGSTQEYVQTCYREFRELAAAIIKRLNAIEAQQL